MSAVSHAVEKIMLRVVRPDRLPLLRFIPPRRKGFPRRIAPALGVWSRDEIPVPEALRGTAGVRVDKDAELEAFQQGPLQKWARLHSETGTFMIKHTWHSLIPIAPRLLRAFFRAERISAQPPAANPSQLTAEELTARVRSFAADLGISAIGVAPLNEAYVVEPHIGTAVGDRVIVCVLEQNYEATQTAPSVRAEKSAMAGYASLLQSTTRLAAFLQELGYRAAAHSPEGFGLSIPFAVASGLGQLGMNGQLLTPHAGSRCRLLLVNTNAPLEFDKPVDYGIEPLCDSCRVCVRRCPSGAIPARRDNYRGVVKVKISTKRCVPVIAQAEGCAVCMKVCPVQRFGLKAVLEEFDATGEVLGKGTDELEGYTWPVDGHFYPATERPKLSNDFLSPPDMKFDPDRKMPSDPNRVSSFGA
jgi:epoxyqueuosine reductase